MAIEIDAKFTRCNTGITTPKDAELKFKGEMVDCGIGVELRDPASIMTTIGLREDTPIEDLLLLLQSINGKSLQKAEIQEKISESSVSGYLSDATNIIGLSEKLYEWGSSDFFQTLIDKLSSEVFRC